MKNIILFICLCFVISCVNVNQKFIDLNYDQMSSQFIEIVYYRNQAIGGEWVDKKAALWFITYYRKCNQIIKYINTPTRDMSYPFDDKRLLWNLKQNLNNACKYTNGINNIIINNL